MTDSEKQLQKLRTSIDQLDAEIISLIQKRSSLAQEIGHIKKEAGGPIYRPDRERDVYEKVSELSQGPLPKSVICSIYREIMSGTIALEHPLRIGFLGPEGSFSHAALRSKFGISIEALPQTSIPDVFRMVEEKKLDYGVVPVENSTEGVVSSTLDMLLKSNVLIYSEHYQKISFSLLGYEEDLTKVKRIYGIRIGNEQCRDWIQANLPQVEVIDTSSTAMAAKLVSERKDGLAVASKIAAEIYGLNIIREGIEDYSENTTRFLVIGKTESIMTKSDKTSLVISIPNRTGALFSILKDFQEANINLTKIESRPLKKNLWEYHFFIDFLGHKDADAVKSLLSKIQEKCTLFKILGSYPTAFDGGI